MHCHRNPGIIKIFAALILCSVVVIVINYIRYDMSSWAIYGVPFENAINRKLLLDDGRRHAVVGFSNELADNCSNGDLKKIDEFEQLVFGGIAAINRCLPAKAIDVRGRCYFWWIESKCAAISIRKDVYHNHKESIDDAINNPCEYIYVRSSSGGDGIAGMVHSDESLLGCRLDVPYRPRIKVVLHVF